jgi:hypothetical protein
LSIVSGFVSLRHIFVAPAIYSVIDFFRLNDTRAMQMVFGSSPRKEFSHLFPLYEQLRAN